MGQKEVMNAIAARLKGYSIIPVGEDKKPLIDWKPYQERLATIQEIRSWKCPKYGIVTGKISNLFVLDVDDDTKFSESPDFYRVGTKRGSHYYFKWCNQLDNKVTTKTKIRESIDVRGEGGYVVAWELDKLPITSKLENPPQWLLDSLPNKNQEGKVELDKNWLSEALANIKEGNRNETLTRVAGSLRSRGYESDFIFNVLKGISEEVGLTHTELKSICQSVGKYPTNIGDKSELASELDDKEDESLEDLVKLEEKVEWAIPNLLPKQGIGFIAGLPESCKTWIALDLAIELARGGLWLDKFKAEKSKVFYIDQERIKPEMVRRIKALLSAKNLSAKEISNNFISRCATKRKIHLNNIQSAQAFENKLDKIRPDFVIVDSLKTFHTGNELSTQDTQVIMQKLQELRDKYKCGFVFVHHETKGVIQRRLETGNVHYTDASGTIDLSQTADTFFNVVSQRESESMMYHTKLNGGLKTLPFLVKVVDLVEDKSKIQVRAY